MVEMKLAILKLPDTWDTIEESVTKVMDTLEYQYEELMTDEVYQSLARLILDYLLNNYSDISSVTDPASDILGVQIPETFFIDLCSMVSLTTINSEFKRERENNPALVGFDTSKYRLIKFTPNVAIFRLED